VALKATDLWIPVDGGEGNLFPTSVDEEFFQGIPGINPCWKSRDFLGRHSSPHYPARG